jgi:tRNA dimethylallyltransferase
MGPTCSGKTSVANAIMDKLNCKAINFDAFQIYKDMDVGTSKLEKDDPHYSRYRLLDIVTPDKTFSVMEYQKMCREELDKILKEDKDVVLVGGTGLYVRAALYDYEFLIEEKRDDSDLEKMDNKLLHSLLEELDYDESLKIHENNRKRMIRAISMIRSSDTKKSERINIQNHKPIYNDIRFLFLSPNREELYKNIDARVIQMVDNGLVDEVKNLLDKYELSLTARQGIGYKEIIEFLYGNCSLEDAIKLIQKRTRNYAKRQVTFFKNQFECETYSTKEELLKSI